jgi:hypothetical protein
MFKEKQSKRKFKKLSKQSLIKMGKWFQFKTQIKDKKKTIKVKNKLIIKMFKLQKKNTNKFHNIQKNKNKKT